jgi:hypothetical protein
MLIRTHQNFNKNKMVKMAGFEPTASPAQAERSTKLSYILIYRRFRAAVNASAGLLSISSQAFRVRRFTSRFTSIQ